MVCMQLELPKETSVRVISASKLLGMNKRELVDRAVLVYLDTLNSYLDLKKELSAWDSLSDEALLNFEKAL